MQKALKLMGDNITSFTFAYGKIVDLNPCKKLGQRIHWTTLRKKIVTNKTVILTNFGDIKPSEFGPCSQNNRPIFKCNTLFLNHCDHNFAYYWLDSKTFPNLERVYINSHPSEDSVLCRKLGKIYLTEGFEMYARNVSTINKISDQEFLRLLGSYDEEDILLGFDDKK